MANIKTLKEYRKELGISQIFVANKLKISRTSLMLKENGKVKFSGKELQYLAMLYNISDIQQVKLD